MDYVRGYTPLMAENMEPYKFRIRPSMVKRAMRIAEKRGDNFSEVLRDAVKDYIRTNEHLLEDDEGDGPEVSGRRGTPEPPADSPQSTHE